MRVLFVCLGNICRSPTAEGVLRALLEREGRGLSVRVDSAGTGDWHVGEPPDHRTRAVARSRGFDLEALRARQVCAQDFELFDLILAMDRQNLAVLEQLRPDGSRAQLALFLEHALPESELREVPDPYEGQTRDFEQVLELIVTGSRALIERWRRSSQGELEGSRDAAPAEQDGPAVEAMATIYRSDRSSQ